MSNQKVLVAGSGKSGIAAARLMLQMGGDVVLYDGNDKLDAEELKEKVVKVSIKTGEGGRVFGSVSTKEIAAEAKKQLGYDLDKKKMHCEPIKNLGFHDVAIKVHPQVTATLRVKVEEK